MRKSIGIVTTYSNAKLADYRDKDEGINDNFESGFADEVSGLEELKEEFGKINHRTSVMIF